MIHFNALVLRDCHHKVSLIILDIDAHEVYRECLASNLSLHEVSAVYRVVLYNLKLCVKNLLSISISKFFNRLFCFFTEQNALSLIKKLDLNSLWLGRSTCNLVDKAIYLAFVAEAAFQTNLFKMREFWQFKYETFTKLIEWKVDVNERVFEKV